MAKSTNYYNVDDFNKYKKSQRKCIPPRINVLAAAMHIQTFFDNKKFTFGFMGGLPMLCLGYKREMPDLHIVYDGKDFERLQAKLGSDRRVRLPIGMNPLLPFKILVWTGPSHKDYGCTVDATIELDFIPSGTSGSPVSGELARSLVLLGLQTSGGGQMVFKSLNTQYLMATLLSYCKARDLLWDPRKDILYLCKHETEEVHRTRGQLNNKEVKEMFLGTSFFSRLDMDTQRLCYHALLNTQPPPTMSITPPSMSIAPPTPQNQPIPRPGPDGPHKDVDPRLPRSRYRKAADQRSSSGSAADRGAQVHTKAQSVDHLQDPGRLSYIEGVQYVRCAKPQAVLVTAVNKNARNSMPNLTVDHHALQSRYGSAQDVRKASPQEQIHKVPRTVQAHDCPSSSEPQSTHTSSRLDYGADFLPAHMDRKDPIKRTDRYPEAGDSILPDSTDPTVPVAYAMRSQKSSLHDAASPEREQVIPQQVSGDTLQSQRGKLHMVGPEGVYGAPQTPPKTGQIQIEHQRHHSAPPPQTRPACVFELDAGAPMQITIVAELPANSIAPLSMGQHTTQDETAGQPETPPRPSTFRASSAPCGDVSLPAILVAGRPGTHIQRQPHDQPSQPTERESTFSTHQTNAYRYSSYVFPSPAVLEASQEGPAVPTYKAYRPFVLTNELNRNDSVSSVYSPAHKRDASDDSTASHDSTKLAKEYQELLQFERGYGSS